MAEILPGLVSVTFRKLSPAEIIRLCQEAKIEVIEWGGDIHVPHGDLAQAKEVAQLTADAGLKIVNYGSYYRAGVSEHDGLPFEKVLETALELGTPCVRVLSGNLSSSKADLAYREWVVEEIHRVSELAKASGIQLALECHPHTLTDTYMSARQLLDEVGHPNCKMIWQPHNGIDFEQSLEGLHALLPELYGVHVFQKGAKAAERCRLQTGEDCWPNYLELAGDCDYVSHASLEFVREDDPQQFLEDASCLREWIEMINHN